MSKKKKSEEKVQVHSVWCPNCGIPRNARFPLKSYFRKSGKVKFYCSACGFAANFVKPGKDKEEKKEDISITGKDIKGLTQAASMVGKLIK